VLLGFDIGGTSIKTGIFDDDFNLINKYQIFYNEMINSDNFPEFLIEKMVEIIKTAESDYPDLSAVACGVPGVVSAGGVIKVAPNMKGIIDFPIKDILESKIKFPFKVDNDANVAALAELHLGAGKNNNYFIYVTLGTGIGGAVIADGKIFRGSSGGAGEIGHLIIDYANKSYDNRNYRFGTLEVLSGRSGILNLAKEILENNPVHQLNKIKNFDVEDIAILAEKNNFLAQQILDITAQRIASALVSIANLLDIPDFVIGGGISKSNYLLTKIEENLILRALPSISGRIKLTRAKFVENTGIVGAAVLSKFYTN
jgi:glucokinase